ncbi:MAG: penicillin-binding protein 2, partial [Deltaproteobacteria bacterium]|nr:penicillin-binding protein 2 [Deltaproteobacteria bacterium]
VRDSEAAFGVALAMKSDNGEILAMAHYPSFNPNDYPAYDKETYFNRAITSGYEPGSTMKVLTTAVALEEKVVNADTLLYCEDGQWEYFDGIIHDTSDHGWLNLGGVIQVSSNICAAKIGLTIPKAVFAEYLARLGFGHRIGIFTDNEGKRLAGEAEGYVLPVDKWTPVDHAAIAFGHGILVSPLQMMTAINTLATGGLRVQPRLVREVYDNSGQKTDSAQTLPPLRIFSPETAQKVKGFMMEVVTPKGTGEKAMVEGYSVAGKTGTTELYDIEARGYSKTKHIASFVGFVPAENPELTIMVLVEEPKKGRYGGVVAAPVFREIAQRALPLLGVWPREGVRRVSGAVP